MMPDWVMLIVDVTVGVPEAGMIIGTFEELTKTQKDVSK